MRSPPSEWPVEVMRVPSRLVILMASSARSRIVQLLVHFHQPHLSISQQSVAELVGIELGAGVGYYIILGDVVSEDETSVAGGSIGLDNKLKGIRIYTCTARIIGVDLPPLAVPVITDKARG